jgi:hypothetical protein
MVVLTPEIQVDFALTPADKSACPLFEYAPDVRVVEREIHDDECHLVIARPEDGGEPVVQHVFSPACICRLFLAHRTIPRIMDVTEDALRIQTCLVDKDELAGLYDDLREVAEVEVLRIQPIEAPNCVEMLDLSPLTAKERDTLEVAVRNGYYGRPREISLADLAEQFGVTKQAISRRLNNAESKIIRQVFQY